jgi:prolyl oligopeptidase PreP (S9A serine peptidase family)
MKKNFLQDVVPSSQKRSIRDVPLPTHKEPQIKRREVRAKVKEERVEEDLHEPIMPIEEEIVHEDAQDEQEYVEIKKRPAYKKTKTTFMKKIIIGLTIGVLIFIGIFISRTDAKISITPKETTQSINLVVPLDESNKLATKTQISKTATKTLPATAEQQVEKQASGKIKIINKHKETSQELVKNTRFQTPSGLIYRIRDSVQEHLK